MTYKNFSKYVLRVPLFSFSFYKKLTESKELDTAVLRQVCKDPILKEAIFLASPSLYQEFEKWYRGEITDSSVSERIEHSVLKYISRMSSRCTPFGLFAGTSIGSFAEQTTIVLQDKTKNKRHTRLDMNYLVALSQDIVAQEKIKNQLKFYPNTSIYNAGKQLRYVEYTYVNSRRVHHIVAVEHSDYIQVVLEKANQGALLQDLAELLVDEEITIEEAKGFIDQLIESQLLISELEPSVSGAEFLDQMLPVLKKIEAAQEIVLALEKAQKELLAIDKKLGNDASIYIKLSDALKKLGTGFELKYMFQTDMIVTPTKNCINTQSLHTIRKAIRLLNKISLSPQETLMTRFQAAFYERYENREVPLSKALDVEIGVGFLQNQGSGDVSAIVDDLVLPFKENNQAYRDIKLSPIHTILQKKLLESINEQKYSISLQDQDFESLKENWDDLPDTISSMVEFVTINGEEKIIFSSAGGSSAANLLGRFCHGDAALHEYTQEIIDQEAMMNPNKILAEIVHLPESRVGNILMRPNFRKYEIPYLAKSIVDHQHQIPLDDLMISTTSNGYIKLRSKKHNKEVIPRLTNAHNFSGNALPIYQFLANMQSHNKRGGISFDWGPLQEEYSFLPRVDYRGVILSPAIWHVTIEEIQPLVDKINNKDAFITALNDFSNIKKLPQYIVLVDGDNELLINMKNITSVKMVLHTVKNRSRFKLQEFLHTEKSLVEKGNESYTNQVIISFYNDKKLKNIQN